MNENNIIYKNNIPNEFSFFKSKLNEGFSLKVDDESKVIFGFNGIGKSTLFKIIKAMNFDNVDFMDYDYSNNSMINDNVIKLSYHINDLAKLEEEIKLINSKLQIAERLKNNGLSNTNLRKAINKDLDVCSKNKVFPQLKSNEKDVADFYSKFNDVDMKIVFNHYSDLLKITTAEQEIENYKKKILCNAFEMIKESVDMEKKECPLCGTSTDWQKSLDDNIKNLSTIKSELLEKYSKDKISTNSSIINRQLEAVNYLKDKNDLLFDLSFSTSLNDYKEIKQLLEDKKAKENSAKKLLSKAKEKYTLVESKRDILEADMKRYFSVDKENISFDSSKYIISINFPREIKTYSTGEINLITFLYSIYSFLGSDKTVLILDDPVSSLDMINQYKIAFEIVNNSVNKKMLIFTHSTEFINIINSQHKNHFKFLYLEESNGVIYLDEIECKNNNTPNIISILNIKDNDYVKNEGLIDYLIKRDNSEKVDYEICHYDVYKHIIDDNPSKLSNHKLAKLIDEFSNFTHEDFYKNSYEKIKYIIALRIWVEKQLYLSINPLDNKKQQIFLKNKKTLHEKIMCIFESNAELKINGKNIKREQLMCKKVMLNQGVHYNSQIEPFAYAINLSLDDLSNEIKEIKQMFC